MESIKRKLERLVDRTKINTQRLVGIVKGKGKTGRTASSEVEPELEPAATRTLPQLPIEVWENVINHLWDDHWTLRQCSLVCRAWYPPSRFHLHRQIYIQSIKGVRTYAKMLKQMPELSKWAHDMTILGNDPSSLLTAATLLAHKLPRLEKLSIRNSEWKPWTMHKDIFLHLSAFSVTCLLFNDVTFPSITVFGRLLCALPGLVELTCINLRFIHDHFHHDTLGPYRDRVNIRSLSLSGFNLTSPEKLVDFFAHPCISSRLETLSIDDQVHMAESQHQWPYQRLLDAASSSLSQLRLSLKYLGQWAHREVSAADSMLSFTHNTSLQRLVLAFPDSSGVSDLDALCQFLLSISSGQLREIVILFKWFRSAMLDDIMLKTYMLNIDESARHKEIDNYLSSASFRTLSKVEFALECRIVDPIEAATVAEQWKQYVVPLFPRLADRGIFCATMRGRGYGNNYF